MGLEVEVEVEVVEEEDVEEDDWKGTVEEEVVGVFILFILDIIYVSLSLSFQITFGITPPVYVFIIPARPKKNTEIEIISDFRVTNKFGSASL